MEKLTSAINSDAVNDHGTARELEKPSDSKAHLERVDGIQVDLVYDDAEHEPQLRFRTWVALAAMWLFNYVVVFTLLSPPVVVSSNLATGVCLGLRN